MCPNEQMTVEDAAREIGGGRTIGRVGCSSHFQKPIRDGADIAFVRRVERCAIFEEQSPRACLEERLSRLLGATNRIRGRDDPRLLSDDDRRRRCGLFHQRRPSDKAAIHSERDQHGRGFHPASEVVGNDAKNGLHLGPQIDDI